MPTYDILSSPRVLSSLTSCLLVSSPCSSLSSLVSNVLLSPSRLPQFPCSSISSSPTPPSRPHLGQLTQFLPSDFGCLCHQSLFFVIYQLAGIRKSCCDVLYRNIPPTWRFWTSEPQSVVSKTGGVGESSTCKSIHWGVKENVTASISIKLEKI